MTPWRTPAWTLLALAVVLAACAPARRALDLEGWNVLLVTLDTLRQDRVGVYGYERSTTPRLDEWARKGVIFDEATAATPTTLASHTSILSGMHPPRHGVRGNAFYALSDEHGTLAEILGEEGYQTAAVVGSMVLERRYGLAQGFDQYDDARDTMAKAEDRFDASRPAHEVTRGAFRATASFRRDAPFFLWVHYYDPHLPNVPYPKFVVPGGDARGSDYDSEVAFMDHNIGVLLDELGRQGLLDRTLIVVVADHGEGFAGPHEEDTHGMFLYRDTIRVPLFFVAEGAIRGDRRSDALARHVDLVPTILDLLAIDAPDGVQGRSLRPSLEGEPAGDAPISYSETLLPWDAYGWSPLFQVRDERWKFIEGPRPELYDLASDPDELHDVAGMHPDRVERYRALVEEVRRDESRDGGSEPRTDPEMLERLHALGYVAAGRGGDVLPDLSTLRHPRDVYPIVEELDEAAALEAAGRTEEAIRKLEALRGRDPDNYDIARRLANLRMVEAQWAAAVLLGRELVERRPDLPHSSYLLADVYANHARYLRRQGSEDRARERFEQAIEVLRGLPDEELLGAAPAVRLGGYLAEVGREQEALETYGRAIELEPAHVTARREAARILVERGDPEAALAHLDAVLRRSPADLERLRSIHVLRMRVSRDLGRSADARESAVWILANFPDDPAGTLARRIRDQLDGE